MSVFPKQCKAVGYIVALLLDTFTNQELFKVLPNTALFHIRDLRTGNGWYVLFCNRPQRMLREQLCTLSRSTSCGSHTMVPLRSHLFSPWSCCLELEGLLGKFGQDSQRIEDSVLVGCSNEQEAWFALDLGLKSASSVRGMCCFPDRYLPAAPRR